MVDQKRSAIMRAVKQEHTTPELKVRSALHSLGLRFRLHRRDLPGTPDIVLPRHQTAIFVHGCFWHRHVGCRLTTTPKSNISYWLPKFEANVKRDARKADALHQAGWRVIVVWECETRNQELLLKKLAEVFKINRHVWMTSEALVDSDSLS